LAAAFSSLQFFLLFAPKGQCNPFPRLGLLTDWGSSFPTGVLHFAIGGNAGANALPYQLAGRGCLGSSSSAVDRHLFDGCRLVICASKGFAIAGSKPNVTLPLRCWFLPIVGLPNIGKISQHPAGRAPWTALVRFDPIQPDSFLAGCVMSSLFSQRRSMHVVNGARVHELRSNDEGRSDE
jgi:hypothetical protein